MPSDNLLSTIPNKPTLNIGKKKEIPNNKKVFHVKKIQKNLNKKKNIVNTTYILMLFTPKIISLYLFQRHTLTFKI